MPSELLAGPMRPFVVAHRAGNDLVRLRHVEALGAAVVEADVHLFRGRAEVRHLKTLGPVPLLWDRWQLSSAFRPRLLLRQLLEAAPARARLMLDLKGRDPLLSTAVLGALRRAEAPAPLTISARCWDLLEPFRRRGGFVPVHSVGTARQLRRLARRYRGTRLDAISIHERLLDPETVAQLTQRAELLLTWPVNSLDRARELVGWGVRGLITDVPELFMPPAPREAGA